MKFIDSAKIYLKPGDGGKGCLSYYYRGKKRFPSGGNGGVGGSVYLQGNSSLNSLTYLKYHPHQKAGNGLHGKGKNQNGRSGKDKIIEGLYLKRVKTNINPSNRLPKLKK